MDTGEDYLQSEPKSSEYFDASLRSHRNLRHDRLTHTLTSSYFSSFTDVLLALLGMRESHEEGNLETNTVSFWSFDYNIEEPDGIQETFEVDSHRLSGESRVLQKRRKNSRSAEILWCK